MYFINKINNTAIQISQIIRLLCEDYRQLQHKHQIDSELFCEIIQCVRTRERVQVVDNEVTVIITNQ